MTAELEELGKTDAHTYKQAWMHTHPCYMLGLR